MKWLKFPKKRECYRTYDTPSIILLNFRKWFKYGVKTQKLLAQGVWGKICESSVNYIVPNS